MQKGLSVAALRTSKELSLTGETSRTPAGVDRTSWETLESGWCLTNAGAPADDAIASLRFVCPLDCTSKWVTGTRGWGVLVLAAGGASTSKLPNAVFVTVIIKLL